MIIQPAREFEGGEINVSGRIVKDFVRLVSFKEEKNKNGNYFFILPAYKVDSHGRGVWYKVVTTRKDFGIDNAREMYIVEDNDPVTYFENKVKIHFPDYAKVTEEISGGRKRKKFPTYGRLTKTVLYNVAYLNELHLGAHVLFVPVVPVGQAIQGWHNTKGPDGNFRPMLNDYKRAIPVRLELKMDAQGQPWQIEIDASKVYELPEELAKAENLYNLDEVIYHPSKDYLIQKLESITPSDIFHYCMKGYQDPSSKLFPVRKIQEDPINSEFVTPTPQPVLPTSKVIQAPSISVPIAKPEPLTFKEVKETKEVVPTAINPAKMTVEELKKFLSSKTE